MSGSRNGIVVKWAAVILAAVGMFAGALWSLAGVHNKAAATESAVETIKADQKEDRKTVADVAAEVSEIKADVKVLLERTKR